MYKYAQLENNVVVAIINSPNVVEGESIVDITDLEKQPNVFDLYNPTTGAFEGSIIPDPETPGTETPIPGTPVTEDRIAALEKKIEENNLVQVEALTAIYEELQSLKKTAE